MGCMDGTKAKNAGTVISQIFGRGVSPKMAYAAGPRDAYMHFDRLLFIGQGADRARAVGNLPNPDGAQPFLDLAGSIEGTPHLSRKRGFAR